MKKGAYDFVTKPFRADHLVLIVRRALEKQELERKARELQQERARNLYDLASEQSRLRTIVNCMADGVLVTNRDLEVVLCNPAFRRLLELPSPSSHPVALKEYVEDERLIQALQSLLSRAGGETEFISQELQRGNTWVRAVSALVYGPEREVIGTVNVLHDISSLKEIDRMKSDFVNQVSHELRAPLAAIKQQHTVILEGLAGELTVKQEKLLSRAQARMQGLLDMVSDLLDVAKIESGHVFQQQVVHSLQTTLAATVELLQPKAQKQGISLKLEVQSDLPLIQADPRSMEEVFTNLLSNAINYSPDGGIVAVSAVSQGGYLEVCVSDTGIGIAHDEISKIFERFYRVKHPQTRNVIGTGLGLAIVKGVIEAHRGSIKVESEPGVGTTFRVSLPVISEGNADYHDGE
jgi:signal transduction histidine kinase